MEKQFDTIVIWAWSGWLTVTFWLAGAWKKVALVEWWKIGWDCTNSWCVPSKALIDIANKKEITSIKDALKEVRNRRQQIRDEETKEEIEKHNIKFFSWYASFVDKNTIEIDKKERLTAKNIVISSWSHPLVFPINWLKKEDILTNENIFELEKDIKNLAVIWWWYIWCELAEAFANLWVKVTLIQRNKNLIPREEAESSEILEKIFKEKNIEVLTNCVVENAIYEKNEKKLIVQNSITKEKKEVVFDGVLVALWRWANTSNLGLEKIWVNFDKRWIFVDKYNRTNIKNIFAIWDCVNSNPLFTHWANNEWRWVVRNIIFPFIKNSTRNSSLPATLYTNIEVARVWKTREELLKNLEKEDIVTKIIYFDKNDRAKLSKETTWFVKINFKRLSWKILWATIVSKNAWEMMSILTSAIENKISAYKLSKQVFSYPTKSETIKKVCDQFVVETLSNIKKELKYFLKSNILQIITWIIWLSIISFYIIYKKSTWVTNLDIARNFYNFLTTNFWWPILYIFVYAIRPIVFFPATFLTFMSGAVFGVWGWFLYTMIWENMSANLAYGLWRIFWKKIIPEWSTWFLWDIKSRCSESTFIPILMTRLLFFPFDLVNYISWILKVHWKWFFLWTLVWIIPGALVFIIAWASIENAWSFDFSQISFDKNFLFISLLLFVWSLWLAKFLKKKWF